MDCRNNLEAVDAYANTKLQDISTEGMSVLIFFKLLTTADYTHFPETATKVYSEFLHYKPQIDFVCVEETQTYPIRLARHHNK